MDASSNKRINQLSLEDKFTKDIEVAEKYIYYVNQSDPEWRVGAKLWNTLTQEQQKLILFQKSNYNEDGSRKQTVQGSMERPRREIPSQHLKTTDSIVKPPNSKEESQIIPRQYQSKRVEENLNGEEENELSIVEEITGSIGLDQAYAQICNANNVYRENNTFICRAHLEYIARLSRQDQGKSLAIIDSGADTHVFGKGWIPLFEHGVHTPTSDLIGFDEIHARKKGLPIGPHTALVKN